MAWWDPLGALAELALPAGCGGCSRPGSGLCPRCRRSVDRLLATPAREVTPDPPPTGMPTVWATASYTGVMVGLLNAAKEQGRRDLTRLLAPLLREAIACCLREQPAGLTGPPVVVPVPTSPRARRDRGRDPLLELAGAALAGEPRVRLAPVLRVTRRVRDQAGLSAAQRSVNLSGAMRARTCPGEAVVLVDDIVTTGATLVEAARALRLAGVAQVAAAVVAVTPRRHTGHRPGGQDPIRAFRLL